MICYGFINSYFLIKNKGTNIIASIIIAESGIDINLIDNIMVGNTAMLT